ncbi:Mitochondrial fission protein [Entophlyctis luteolus]|nr:Mitochondrial fission protein [Entophlyctis luteolus]
MLVTGSVCTAAKELCLIFVSGSHDQKIVVASIDPDDQFKECDIHNRFFSIDLIITQLATLTSHTSDVYALQAFSGLHTNANGVPIGHIASAGDYTIRLWDLVQQKPTSVLTGHTGYVSCFKIRGRRAFSGSWDTTIRSWNLEVTQVVVTGQFSNEHVKTGKAMHVFKGHSNIVNCLDVTNTDIFSGSWDHKIIQWSRAVKNLYIA